ncbi:MAG TPA: ATP-binding protein, partial [bacterium]|nr:ATP-binding protein [bacterium]
QPLVLDFARVPALAGTLSAPLGGLLSLALHHGATLQELNLQRPIHDLLVANGFLKVYRAGVRQPPRDFLGTTIGYQHFQADQYAAFIQHYLREGVAAKGLPGVAPLLRRQFEQGLFELLENARQHAASPVGIFCCGDLDPDGGLLRFCVADLGRGIPANVRAFLGRRIGSADAIAWVMQEGHTTRTGDVPGGLGLKLVLEFLQAHRGTLRILSANGYWESAAGEVVRAELSVPFPGTVVWLELDTAHAAAAEPPAPVDAGAIF